jgi:FAD binding domain
MAGTGAADDHGLVKVTDQGPVQTAAVLVVGGGPAGLAAATELAWHGVGCVLIEPRAEVSHRRPRAKTTSIRTMEHLRRWGVADALRAAAPLPVAWSQRVTFCESLSGRRITDFDGAFGLTAARDGRFAESGQQVPQPVVEEVLREHLRAPADGLPRDAAAIQRAKRTEFYSLGLVLGYSYAGSPLIQPGPAAAIDVTRYTPDAEPGARLPHCWLPDGSSLYDRLGRGFTLVGPVGSAESAVVGLVRRARRRRIPLTVVPSPPDYPWQAEFLLVRPDQHIAWRAGDPVGLDLETAAGFGLRLPAETSRARTG